LLSLKERYIASKRHKDLLVRPLDAAFVVREAGKCSEERGERRERRREKTDERIQRKR